MNVGRWATEALELTLILSLPVLVTSLVVGVTLGILQAVTQVQDQTLGFVPKLAAVALALALSGAWMGSELSRFTQRVFEALGS
jgi:flagellar biosynthetic protein FliQ